MDSEPDNVFELRIPEPGAEEASSGGVGDEAAPSIEPAMEADIIPIDQHVSPLFDGLLGTLGEGAIRGFRRAKPIPYLLVLALAEQGVSTLDTTAAVKDILSASLLVTAGFVAVKAIKNLRSK